MGFLVQSSTLVKAQVVVPGFPTCSNPTGTLKVSYPSGIHGIPGMTGEFRGSDSIYTIDDKTLIQCFCSEDGKGIQTNWWRIDALTQDEIDILKKLGWLFIPTGSVWGLDESAYLAKNSNYDCGGFGGQVLGAAAITDPEIGSVLGLAVTGNSLLVFSLIVIGSVLILFGKQLSKSSKD